jgi:deoxyhypusine synthase
MVALKKSKHSKFLTAPTRPVSVDRDRSVAGLLEKMESIGLGGKQLAEAHRVWLDMLGDNTTIFVAATGSLVAAGMKRLLACVIKNRFVDVLVLSGNVVFQDLHETLGRHHFQSHPSMSDEELELNNINRVADLLVSGDEYREAEEWVGGFANQLDPTRPFGTREFLHLMGRELAEIAAEDGLLTAAYKSRVPVFCPDVIDSSIGVGIAGARYEKKNTFTFDLVSDVLDIMHIANKARVTGVINIGGGSSKSFVQLAEIAQYILKTQARGHKYAISITSDIPNPGTGNNATFKDESLLFGKLSKGATTAYVNCDATIALPFIITALSQTAAKYMKGRKRPNYTFLAKDLVIDVP